MKIEINENNDFDYIQNYLKAEIRNDFVKHMKYKNISNEDLKNVYQHFELYNKFIKQFIEESNILKDENNTLRKALEFNLNIIEKLQTQSNQNAIDILDLKNKKSWF